MIRVAVVDDHQAIRIGLYSALRFEPGLVAVGAASTGAEVPAVLDRSRPDVVLLDYHLPDADGLTLCRAIKRRAVAPAVVLYSAFADDAMTVPARVAGADGILHKGRPACELFEAIRAVARGGAAVPPVPEALVESAAVAVDADDVPILTMLVDGMPGREIARELGIPPAVLGDRIDAMLERLKVPVHAR